VPSHSVGDCEERQGWIDQVRVFVRVAAPADVFRNLEGDTEIEPRDDLGHVATA
jgi:hypothetical protein